MSEMIGDIRLGRRASMALGSLPPRQRTLVRKLLARLGDPKRKAELKARLHRLDPDHPYYITPLITDLRIIFRIQEGAIEATDIIGEGALESHAKRLDEVSDSPDGAENRSANRKIKKRSRRKTLDRCRRMTDLRQ